MTKEIIGVPHVKKAEINFYKNERIAEMFINELVTVKELLILNKTIQILNDRKERVEDFATVDDYNKAIKDIDYAIRTIEVVKILQFSDYIDHIQHPIELLLPSQAYQIISNLTNFIAKGHLMILK